MAQTFFSAATGPDAITIVSYAEHEPNPAYVYDANSHKQVPMTLNAGKQQHAPAAGE